MTNEARLLAYACVAELAGRWGAADVPRPVPVHHRDLTPYELKAFSQNGEDGVIAEVLRRTGVGPRRFVEFGAEAGLEGNCVFLAEVLGWSGLFMEAASGPFSLLQQRFRDRPSVTTLQAAVTPQNVNDLIRSAGLEGDIDVLSIDIDGHDYWVWKAIHVVRPRLVVIEYNAHIPYPDCLTQPLSESGPWQGTDFFGASLAALEHCARGKGYRLVHTDLAGVNAFFVRADLAAPFPSCEVVPRRSPNFFLTGQGHPRDPEERVMVDPRLSD